MTYRTKQKTIFIIYALLLLAAPLQGMDFDDDVFFHPQYTQQETEAATLYLRNDDILRFGALSYGPPTQEDLVNATNLIDSIQKEETNIRDIYNYTQNRIAMAKAVQCGLYDVSFMEAALDARDGHLLRFLIQNKADVNIKILGMPLTFYASTLPILKILVEQGHASLEERSSTMNIVHRACYEDRDPPILAYCVRRKVVDANSTTIDGENALDIWAKRAFYSPPKKNRHVISKLHLLLEAGINVLHENNNKETPLYALHTTTRSHEDDYWKKNGTFNTLQTCAALLSKAMKKRDPNYRVPEYDDHPQDDQSMGFGIFD